MPRPQSILYLLAIAALGFVAIVMFVKQNVDPQLTRIIQDNIEQQLSGTDYFATLRGARFIEGFGFEIQDLKIQNHARPQSPVFHTEALMVNSPTTLSELLSKKIQPTAIELKHAKLEVERDASGAINLSEVVKSLFKFDSKKPFIPISLKNCSISVTDNFQGAGANSKFPRNVRVSLHDINLDITEIQHQQRQLLKLVGTAKGDVKDVALSAWELRKNISSIHDRERLDFLGYNLVLERGDMQNYCVNTQSPPYRSVTFSQKKLNETQVLLDELEGFAEKYSE